MRVKLQKKKGKEETRDNVVTLKYSLINIPLNLRWRFSHLLQSEPLSLELPSFLDYTPLSYKRFPPRKLSRHT